MNRLATFALVLAFVITAGTAHSAIIYVNHAATGANDGTSWGDAYTDLQAALAAMSASDEVWVAAGTYYPTATTDRYASFVMSYNRKLYGGFAGTETSTGQRDIDSNPTILSGNIGDPGSTADNSFAVVKLSYPDSNTVVDGFNIQDGNADEGPSDAEGYAGGGMQILDSSIIGGAVKVRNVIYRDNQASRGGAVYVEAMLGSGTNGAAEFENVSFYDNTATGEHIQGWGGALYSVDSHIEMNRVRFYGGSADYGGGACIEGGAVWLYNAVFHDNSALYGGGLNTYLSSAFIANTTFTGNSATTGGGGIFSNQTSMSLVNVIMWDDSAPTEPEIRYGTTPPGISYSLIEGCWPGLFWDSSLGTDNGNNLDSDPLFLDPASDDFSLDDCSPAVNAGNVTMPALPATDLDGDSRIVGAEIDMGALENQNAAIATVLFVDASATGAGDGSSWADAFNDLQDALAASDLCPVIDQIWVAAGTYKPTSGYDRDISFEVREKVSLYGGFAGTEVSPAERNLSVNETILSGELASAGPDDNSQHVVDARDADSTTAIDGFTISDGWGEQALWSKSGGGIYIVDGSPVIRNVIIENNGATTGGGASVGSGAPRFENVIFRDNLAFGVAISPYGLGGGLYVSTSSRVELSGVSFEGNSADNGGAIYHESGDLYLTDGIITGCTSQQAGGGIYATGAGETVLQQVTFDSCGSESAAGGIRNSNHTMRIIACRFIDCYADSYGGAVFCSDSDVEMTNSVFFRNGYVSQGGALFNLDCSPVITNCSFSKNFAFTGGAMYNDGVSLPVIVNSIFWADSALIQPEILNRPDATPSISYSIIEGSGGSGGGWNTSLGSDGGHNLDLDPLYFNETAGDLHIGLDSPAFDAGNDAAPNLPSTDFDGYARIWGTSVDMGVYEVQESACPGAIVYVDSAAAGMNDGSSWADAFNDLRSALQVTAVCLSVEEIWVAAGTYFPTSGSDQNARFELQGGLAICGGFAGWESLLSERDIENNVTILSGEIGIPGTSDNTGNIVWAAGAGTDSTAVLDGFTVTAASYKGGWNRGAVFCYDDSEPIFRNLKIVDNAGTGLNSYDARPEVYDSEISGSAASGIYAQESSVAQFFDVLITGNGDSGVHIGYGCTVWLKNAIVSDNQAVDGGGFFVENEAHLVIYGALITGNTASNEGGGIHSAYSGGAVTLVNITMSDNVAVRGGGIYNGQGFYTIPLYNSIMWGDSATSEGDEFYTELTSYNAFWNSIVEGCGGSGAGWTDTLNFDGGGNLDEDPLFVDEDGGDFRLTSCSPAVDVFDTTGGYFQSLPATDLDGNARITNSLLDMGGYEYQGRVYGPVLYVDQSAGGAGDGYSWADACPQLRDALAYAGTCDRISEIWVAAGTYTPTGDIDRTATFTLRNGLALYGGFAGTESLLSERDAETNVTVLSGEIGAASLDDNSYHVIWADSVDATAVLDGFTVTRGNADGTIPNNVGGGFIGLWQSGPTITGIRFVDNHAWGYGGGMYVNGLIELAGVVFENNSAGEGGGATIYDSGVVKESEFIGNTATANGGALFTGSSKKNFLENVTFSGNSAVSGGAVYIQMQDTLVMTNVVFDRNTAANGGAIYNNFGGFDATNVSWSGNSATGSGGGIYNHTYTAIAPISIINSIMWGDSAATGDEIHNTLEAPSISYSLVAGSGGSGGGWNSSIGSDGGNNLDTDPMYVDPVTGDLSLNTGSPAIDAGNALLAILPPTDIAGNPRVTGADVDMGAYEYYVAGKSKTVVIDKTGEAIYFISDLDTLAVMNFTSEELDSVKVTKVKETPPNIKEGSDWVPIHYIFEAFPSEAAFVAWMRVFYDQEDFDDSGLTDETLLSLWRYDEPAAKWEYKESVVDIDKNLLTAIDVTGFSVWGMTNSKNAVDVEEDNVMPKGYALHQNRPNPFNPSTTIEYQLPETGHVELTIYNALGRRIVTLVDGPQTAGYKSVRWNGTDRSGAQAASGVYFYRLRAGSFVESKKMILLR